MRSKLPPPLTASERQQILDAMKRTSEEGLKFALEMEGLIEKSHGLEASIRRREQEMMGGRKRVSNIIEWKPKQS